MLRCEIICENIIKLRLENFLGLWKYNSYFPKSDISNKRLFVINILISNLCVEISGIYSEVVEISRSENKIHICYSIRIWDLKLKRVTFWIIQALWWSIRYAIRRAIQSLIWNWKIFCTICSVFDFDDKYLINLKICSKFFQLNV